MREPDQTKRPRVLIIGGYGVFGGRLSRRLARHTDIDVIVAGRQQSRADTHCVQYGGTAARIDTDADLVAAFQHWQPALVIDAAGPYQLYGDDPYRVARAALNVGADYLDLADDADFVAGIATLDDDARVRGRVVLSGCSSVPAISAAAVRALADGMSSIDSIESMIMPGNRAPRGRSLVRAILAQVGRPIRVRRAGQRTTIRGWGDVRRCRPAIAGVAAMNRRYTSPIGAPDLQLFPTYFKARTVRFRAGLELAVMHLGLVAISWFVRLGLLRTASPLVMPLLWVADRLEPFGTDRGAMTVDVIGRSAEGRGMHARWTLMAEAGDGPEIPSTPAYLLALGLCRDRSGLQPGARACLADLTLDDINGGFAPYAIASDVTRNPVMTVFETALADDYARLPPPVRDLHEVLDCRAFAGTARVTRGTGWLSRAIGWCMGFPLAADAVAVLVDMQRTDAGETWRRQFGKSRFRSHLSRRPAAPHGEIWERFGPLSVRIDLTRVAGELHYPVSAVRLYGWIPLPRFLVPASDTREYVNANGDACFDVAISHPLAGFIVRYRGWLRPVAET